METAKKTTQIIELNSAVSRRENTTQRTVAFAGHKAQAQLKRDPPDTVPKPRLNEPHATGKRIDKTQLINKLNFINFQDGTVLINFRHLKYDKIITLKATPQPCLENLVDCRWSEACYTSHITQCYEFSNFLIPNGQNLLKVEAELVNIDEAGISLLLPDECHEISSRRVRRNRCEGINVQLMQNSTVFCGSLMDFNGFSFRVKLEAVPPQTFDWMNPQQPVNIVLSDPAYTYYSGECKIIRHTHGHHTRNYILQPLKEEIQRFKQKEFRSERYELTPSPNMVFEHPFTKLRSDLKIVDLSGSGFSVEEDERNPALVDLEPPGLLQM